MSDQDLDSLIGTQLGRYKITGILGKGGMGIVYSALQLPVERIVALKIVPVTRIQKENFMERFRQEIDVVARLEHVHILPVYDFGEDLGVPYIVMRYLNGGTVKQHIIRGGPLHHNEVVRLIGQVASALDYAHLQGVIHRDIKPSNIILDNEGNGYLADFGTAKLRDDQQDVSSSGIIGTPAYMAPEQAEAEVISPSIDIYALGVSIFEMITGRVPYVADTPILQILMHVRDPIPSMRDYNRSIPIEVDQIVQRAMGKKPQERFRTALELAMALRNAVNRTGGWSDGRERLITETKTIAIDPDLIADSEDFNTGRATPSKIVEEGKEPPVSLDPTPEFPDRFGIPDLIDPTSPKKQPTGGFSTPDTLLVTPGKEKQKEAKPEEKEYLRTEYGGDYQTKKADEQEDDYIATELAGQYASAGEEVGYAGDVRMTRLVATTGEIFPLNGDNILIGRHDPRAGIYVNVDLTPIDIRMRSSRRHARILARKGKYYVWDLRTLNGTFVNGEKLEEGGRQEIVNGDELQFGRHGVQLIFYVAAWQNG